MNHTSPDYTSLKLRVTRATCGKPKKEMKNETGILRTVQVPLWLEGWHEVTGCRPESNYGWRHLPVFDRTPLARGELDREQN